MCSWTATISSSSAGMVPSTVLTLVIRSPQGSKGVGGCADVCLAHGQQAARVVHEDAAGVFFAQAPGLEERHERGQDVAVGQVVLRQALGHADRVAREDDLVGMAGLDELEHEFGALVVGEVVRMVV